MKKAISSLLLSAFIFPGIGQINNRQTLKGITLILVCSGALLFLLVRLAISVIGLIPQKGGITFSPEQILPLTQKVHAENRELIIITIIILGIIWAYSIFDAYRQGKRIDDKKSS